VKLQAVIRSSTPFSAILESQPPWWRLGGGGVVVVAAYAGMLAAALTLGGGQRREVARAQPPRLVVALVERIPPVVEAPVGAVAAGAAEPGLREVRAVSAKPARAVVQRKLSEKAVRASPTPVAEPQASATQQPALAAASAETKPSVVAAPAGAVAGTQSGAGARGNVTGLAAGGGAAHGGSEVLPFMDGMTRPKLLEMVEPIYTREARDARVAGLFLAKCVITTSGRLQKCRVVKGLPRMDQAVLDALSRWRYSPVIYQGKPVAVDYVIQVRLSGP
jgi:protein TonB